MLAAKHYQLLVACVNYKCYRMSEHQLSVKQLQAAQLLT